MPTDAHRRKLTTILSLDVKGYSRLMREDEAGTVTLTTYRKITRDLLEQHHCGIVDSPCDDLLAEFTGIVDAGKCAAAIQKELKPSNPDFPQNRKS